MRLKNRDNRKPNIHVQMNNKNTKIILRNGFAILTKGTHAGFETVREDALRNLYYIPDNIDFQGK